MLFSCCATFSVRLVLSVPYPEAAGGREMIHNDLTKVACFCGFASYKNLGDMVTRRSGAMEAMEATEAMLLMAAVLPQ